MRDDSDGATTTRCFFIVAVLIRRGVGMMIGSTGKFSQLQTSIICPSGSWKKSWSTSMSSSTTTHLTYFTPFSWSFCSTNNISSHYTNAHHNISCNKKTKQKVGKYHDIVDKLINMSINYILGLYKLVVGCIPKSSFPIAILIHLVLGASQSSVFQLPFRFA